MSMLKTSLAAILLAAGTVFPAMAHITLDNGSAKVGSTYKAILRVGHGCDGKATVALRVRLPEGIISVKPMPKPGWKIEKTLGEYARAYELHGQQQTSGVRELIWSGGNRQHHGQNMSDQMGRAAVRWGGGSPGVSPRRVPWLAAVEHGGNDLILRACAGVNQRLACPALAGVAEGRPSRRVTST